MKKCDHVGIDPSSVNWFLQKGAAFCTLAFPDYFSHLWTGANDLALNHNVCSCARMLACVCARVCVPARACACGCVRACMGACLHVCSVSVYVCVYVGVCARVCVPVSVCLLLVIVMPNGRVTVGSQSGHSRVYSRVSVGSCKNQAFLSFALLKVIMILH